MVTYLRAKHREIRVLLEDRFQPMLRRWVRECLARADALQSDQTHQKLRPNGTEHVIRTGVSGSFSSKDRWPPPWPWEG